MGSQQRKEVKSTTMKQEMYIAYRAGELNTIQKYCTFVGRKSCDFAAAITFVKGLTS